MAGPMKRLRLVLATLLAGGALLIPPAPGWAQVQNRGPITAIYGAIVPGQLRLHLVAENDGTAHVRGFFRTGTQHLVARPNEPAHARFADLDRDGVAGLTEFVARFSPTGTRDHVLLAKITPNREVDEAGTYQLLITDGAGRTLFNGPARVAVRDFN